MSCELGIRRLLRWFCFATAVNGRARERRVFGFKHVTLRLILVTPGCSSWRRVETSIQLKFWSSALSHNTRHRTIVLSTVEILIGSAEVRVCLAVTVELSCNTRTRRRRQPVVTEQALN